LFFRLGDFYEMFFDDAKTASRELELTLTGRSCGQEERAPMCGVPYHAAESYIQRLVQKGYKVAICEQMEDPKEAKGLVRRDITRIITPGTSMNASAVEEGKNNYIMSVNRVSDAIGLAVADITTGEFLVTEFSEEEKLRDEMARFEPAELLVNEDLHNMQSLNLEEVAARYPVYVNPYAGYHYQYDRCREEILRHFGVVTLDGLGLAQMELGVTAAGALLDYLLETQKRDLQHINQLKTYSVQQYMILDGATRRNLELTETMRDKNRKGSLLWVLDYTRTAMGGRLLRRWIEQPLIETAAIEERQDAVECYVENPMLSAELREVLNAIYDIERLMGRVSYGSANARDLLALKGSLSVLPALRELLKDSPAPMLQKMESSFDDLRDIYELLEASIHDDPPITLREGQLIKAGFNEQIDRYRSASTEGKGWLAKLEAKEKEETGIKTLRVGYNRVFGYYLEVSKGAMSLVPDRYIRKQTLSTGERYITEELKQIEDTLLGAREKDEALEYEVFGQIRDQVAANMVRIQKTAAEVAVVDALRSLAEAACQGGYVKPRIQPAGGAITIRQGRHPVVEKMLPEGSFIANDTELDTRDHRIAVITGPNMAGKSTYMRQVAILTLMAQIGSFVPAAEAEISVTDRIFTRVGASDDLAGGQSTFMMEMSEVSNILRHATGKSLLILDEIGRGTSTYDGLSIAWAVVEYISDKKIIGAKTLFATHYHELTELEGQLDGVKNYCVAVKESGEDILFLHKIHEGKGSQSYGIEVAKLAGLPRWVLGRAKEILGELLERGAGREAAQLVARQSVEEEQISLFSQVPEEKSVLEELQELDINGITPMEALQILYRLQNKASQQSGQ
jgi:DNA mismatch repair protein MutS